MEEGEVDVSCGVRAEVGSEGLCAERLAFAVEMREGVHGCGEDGEVGDGKEEGEGEDLHHRGGGVAWSTGWVVVCYSRVYDRGCEPCSIFEVAKVGSERAICMCEQSSASQRCRGPVMFSWWKGHFGGHFLTLTGAEDPPAPIDKRMTSPGSRLHFFLQSLPSYLSLVQHF